MILYLKICHKCIDIDIGIIIGDPSCKLTWLIDIIIGYPVLDSIIDIIIGDLVLENLSPVYWYQCWYYNWWSCTWKSVTCVLMMNPSTVDCTCHKYIDGESWWISIVFGGLMRQGVYYVVVDRWITACSGTTWPNGDLLLELLGRVMNQTKLLHCQSV